MENLARKTKKKSLSHPKFDRRVHKVEDHEGSTNPLKTLRELE